MSEQTSIREQIVAEKLTPRSFAGPRSFARHVLRRGTVPVQRDLQCIQCFGGVALETILFRESSWQIELIAMMPNAIVERHRHNRCESVDLVLAGGTAAVLIGAREFGGLVNRGSLASHLVRVPKGQWHQGSPGADGVFYLSFQQWDGEPVFISEDWEE